MESPSSPPASHSQRFPESILIHRRQDPRLIVVFCVVLFCFFFFVCVDCDLSNGPAVILPSPSYGGPDALCSDLSITLVYTSRCAKSARGWR
ncbi:hypothetical protein BO71DRAFT_97525 [Aspergillus ellipticus CBS 707.79]|uniref:Uncharacterized protein n=1 Tax=Aspergillus ellipticus CBS 707.79 TaxID=1448320 RepID=A0A319EFU1_9EURO|nr:hypothetical protein BO71DRAFT_97525 [Aspergillus ellipticus CBS 707.79]